MARQLKTNNAVRLKQRSWFRRILRTPGLFRKHYHLLRAYLNVIPAARAALLLTWTFIKWDKDDET